jgi:hypothetical protein
VQSGPGPSSAASPHAQEQRAEHQYLQQHRRGAQRRARVKTWLSAGGGGQWRHPNCASLSRRCPARCVRRPCHQARAASVPRRGMMCSPGKHRGGLSHGVWSGELTRIRVRGSRDAGP